MPSADLLRHGEHVMTVCNSCRYCEAYCPVFPDADRGSKSYYYLSLSGYYSKGKSKQSSKNKFSHSLLLRLNEQVHGRSGKADCFNFVLLRPRPLGNAHAALYSLARGLPSRIDNTDRASDIGRSPEQNS